MITVLLAEQDAELGQLRQTIEQIRQEKAKESEQADKLAEVLKGEYLLVKDTIEVVFWYDRTLQRLQAIVIKPRRSLTCWCRRPRLKRRTSTL